MILKGAVIGVGHLGKFHAQKYAAIESVELVGVCDPQVAACDKVATELNTKAFYDHRDLFGEVDVVTIATPTPSHHLIAKDFLNNDIHVLVEKPITATTSEAKELIEISLSKNKKLQVGHIERFNPAFIAFNEKINGHSQQKTIENTQISFIEAKRLAPFNPRGVDVSVVHDLMIHDLDIVLHILKSPVKSIQGVGQSLVTSTLDIAMATLTFENGAMVCLQASRVEAQPERTMRILEKKNIWDVNFSGSVHKTSTGNPMGFEEIFVPSHDAMELETRAFFDSITENKPCLVSAQEGLEALELAEKIVNQIEINQIKVNSYG